MSDESNAAQALDPPPFLSEHDRLQRAAAARSDVISFAGGLPDPKLFPRHELVRAFIATIERPSCAALQYGWPEGLPGLRRYVAERLAERGAHVEPNHVLVTSGAQQAIFLSLHAALRPGAAIGVEDESYPGALDAARAFGARLTSIEDAAQAYYVMPSLSNPRGQPIAPDARRSLLERARRARACIIEDDAYAETVFSGRASRPLLADAASFDLGRGFRRTASDALALRLSYSCVAEDQIVEGTRRLARVLRTLGCPDPSELPRKGRTMPANRPPSVPSRPAKPAHAANPDTKKSGTTPAMKQSRPDRTTSREPDARGPSDRDGNEGHARATGAKGKPAR